MPPRRFVRSEAVIDSSCLRCFLALDLSFPEYNLFRALSLRYYAVHIPQHVWNEVSRRGRRRPRLQRLLRDYPFFKRCNVTNDFNARLLYDQRTDPKAPIHRGEAETIVQAQQRGISEVLIDERKATRIARAHSLNSKGVVGLIRDFALQEIIKQAKPLFDECRRNKFWLDDDLVRKILAELHEDE